MRRKANRAKANPPRARDRDTSNGHATSKGPTANGKAAKSQRPQGPMPPTPHHRATCDALLVTLFALWTRLTGTLRRRGASHHDAEDASADTYLILYQRLLSGTLPLDLNILRPTLYALARERLGALWRRHRPTKNLETVLRDRDQAALMPTARSAYELTALRDEIRHLVARAEKILSPRQREVLMGRLSRLSYAEIAQILGTSVGAARVHWTHAIRKIRRGAA